LGWDNGAWQGVTVTIDDIGTWRAWNGWEWESNGKEANTLGGVLEFAFAFHSTS
jgi:hypothetical protein